MEDQRKPDENETEAQEQEAGDAAATETVETADTGEDLTRLLEDARAKADDHWDQLLRTRAEMDNLAKRHARDLENAHKFGLDNFVRELLQVWDSLELGLSHARESDADVAKLREGNELTLKLLRDVMAKFGVEQIDPQGDAFNPEFHQAMSMQPRTDMAPNHVAAVIQKGYLLNGRLVRPALVMVSQAAAGGVNEQA